VLSALGMVEQLPQASLPPVHVGVAAGPVVVQGGDFFGRTVNLAARIAARASAGQVLVSQGVAESAPPEGVSFVELGELRLEGFARPCGCWRPAGRSVGACFASVGLAECSRPTGPAAARDHPRTYEPAH
jgi:class 3 adenylate cyclase